MLFTKSYLLPLVAVLCSLGTVLGAPVPVALPGGTTGGRTPTQGDHVSTPKQQSGSEVRPFQVTHTEDWMTNPGRQGSGVNRLAQDDNTYVRPPRDDEYIGPFGYIFKKGPEQT